MRSNNPYQRRLTRHRMLADKIEPEELEVARGGMKYKIMGQGGWFQVSKETDGSKNREEIKTTYSERHASVFVVEPVQSERGEKKVTFRLDGSKRYVTVIPYGDEFRETIFDVLATSSPLLPDHIQHVVDYLADEPTGDDNFEGAGFHYTPLFLQEVKRPKNEKGNHCNHLQVFTIEEAAEKRGSSVFVRSEFGSFWRSPQWDKSITQSPNRLGDEKLYLRKIK